MGSCMGWLIACDNMYVLEMELEVVHPWPGYLIMEPCHPVFWVRVARAFRFSVPAGVLTSGGVVGSDIAPPKRILHM